MVKTNIFVVEKVKITTLCTANMFRAGERFPMLVPKLDNQPFQ
jgi:hypothetical protein